MKHLSVVLLLAAGLGITLAASAAAECSSFSVTTTGVAFGVYDTLEPAATTSSGSIEVSCSGDLGLEAAYTISLGTGTSASFLPRRMNRSAVDLVYNLFTDPAHVLVWGDGTGGTHRISDLVPLVHATEYRQYDVFGLIYPQQQIPSGTYSDSIVVSVSF